MLRSEIMHFIIRRNHGKNSDDSLWKLMKLFLMIIIQSLKLNKLTKRKKMLIVWFATRIIKILSISLLTLVFESG